MIGPLNPVPLCVHMKFRITFIVFTLIFIGYAKIQAKEWTVVPKPNQTFFELTHDDLSRLAEQRKIIEAYLRNEAD